MYSVYVEGEKTIRILACPQVRGTSTSRELYNCQSVQVDRKVAEVEFYAEPTASIDKPTTVYWSVLNKCKG